ncbi:MAG: metallophosphoesterase [Acidobacteria bacterium]|nr:metallophosphoesterase [Acidobacteriota bacterium]MBI3656527.1 metallophosphoesterase [Acidobacteriota bacterium]
MFKRIALWVFRSVGPWLFSGLWMVVALSVAVYANDSVVRFAVIGDGGVGCATKDGRQCRIADLMVEYRKAFDFVIMLGDNIYENGDPADFPLKFEAPYRGLLDKQVLFYPALGNHDVERNRWRYESDHVNYPNYQMIDDRDGVRRRYYSYRKGTVVRDGTPAPLIEFFVLDSNRVSYPTAPPDPDQLPWLSRRLKESDAVWKIPYFHHPLYSSARTHGSSRVMQDTFEPLFIEAGVRVTFAGHDHVFEKVAPQNGIHHFVSGAAGKLRLKDVRRDSPLTELFNDYTPHFLIVEVEQDAMSWYLVDVNGEPICFAAGDDQNPVDCRGRIDR